MQLAEVLKLKLNTDPDMDKAFENTSYQYMLACDYISRYDAADKRSTLLKV